MVWIVAPKVSPNINLVEFGARLKRIGAIYGCA